MEKVDIIHPRCDVWFHQCHSLHSEIIINVRNCASVFVAVFDCDPNVVPCLPCGGAQHLAVDCDADWRSNNSVYNSFNYKVDANVASICCDGSNKRVADDRHIGFQQFL